MPAASHSGEADLAACRRAIRKGSKSFYAASLLLPVDVRNASYALYAFCRYSDDVIDLGHGDVDAIAKLQARLDSAYEGAPANAPVDRAFASMVREYGLPKTLPAALIEGLAWDAAGRRYETIEELYDYCARVAGSVGAMMAVLMGACQKDAIARACDLGVAMQLTNISRDIGEDARAGRIYMPLDWLREAGLDIDAWLAKPTFCPEIAAVVRRLLDEAAYYYERGLTGVDFLPVRCRAGIVAAADIYADIGAEIAKADYDSVNNRAFVSTRRKIAWLAKALGGLNFSCTSSSGAPLAANAFLVDAVEQSRDRVGRAAQSPGSTEQVIDLIMRLERRDRVGVRYGAIDVA